MQIAELIKNYYIKVLNCLKFLGSAQVPDSKVPSSGLTINEDYKIILRILY